jgi:hypothetical protein
MRNARAVTVSSVLRLRAAFNRAPYETHLFAVAEIFSLLAGYNPILLQEQTFAARLSTVRFAYGVL